MVRRRNFTAVRDQYQCRSARLRVDGRAAGLVLEGHVKFPPGPWRSNTRYAFFSAHVVVDYLAADNCEDRLQSFDRFIRDFLRVEVIVAEDHQVSEFAGLNRAEEVLFAEKPAVLRRIQAQRLHPRDLLRSE